MFIHPLSDVQSNNIGEGTRIWQFAVVLKEATIGNNVFIGPCATFTNDKMPRSKVYPEAFARITIEDHASIGANATLLPGITIGKHAMVGVGAVVTKDVPDYAVVVGAPAKVVRYIKQNTQ